MYTTQYCLGFVHFNRTKSFILFLWENSYFPWFFVYNEINFFEFVLWHFFYFKKAVS